MHSSPSPTSPIDHPLPRRIGIGDRVIDLATYEVFVAGELRLRLTPKAFGVLRVLLEHEGKPVHRDLLISSVWPRQFPTDDVVTKAIRELRRALSDGDSDEQPVIATLPRIGYQLKHSIVRLDEEPQHAGQEREAAEQAVPVSRRARWLVPAAALLLLTLGSFISYQMGGWSTQSLTAPVAPVTSVRAFAPQLDVQPFTADPGDEGAADISDDGLLVAYSSSRGENPYRIYVRSADGLSERRLTSSQTDEHELQPVFAPDGHQLAYQVLDEAGHCSLRLLDLNGGNARILSDCVMGLLVQMEFARDGSHLLVPNVGRYADGATALRRLDLGSGRIAALDYPASPTEPDVEGRYSPDNRWLLIRRGAAPLSQLLLHQVGSKQPPRLIPGISGLIRGTAWLPDNRNVVFATDATGTMELWRLDTQSGFVERFGGVQGAFPSVAARVPVLVTRQVLRASALFPINLDGKLDETPQPLFASNRSESWPVYAPDGTHLAFVSDRGGSSQIYLGNLSDGSVQRVSQLDDGKPHALSFAPNGRQIAFSLQTLDNSSVGLVDLDGRWTRLLETGLQRPQRLRFAADNRLWLEAETASGTQLFVLQDASAKPSVFSADGSDCSGRVPQPAADGSVFYLGPNYYTLRRVDSGTEPASCSILSQALSWSAMDAWTVQNNAVYALLNEASANALYRIESNGKRMLVEPLTEQLGSAVGIAVRADLREAILSVSSDAQADLMLVRGF